MEIEPRIEKLSPGVLIVGEGKLFRDSKEVQPTYAPLTGKKTWFVVSPGNYEYEFLNGKRRKLPFIKEILKEAVQGRYEVNSVGR